MIRDVHHATIPKRRGELWRPGLPLFRKQLPQGRFECRVLEMEAGRFKGRWLHVHTAQQHLIDHFAARRISIQPHVEHVRAVFCLVHREYETDWRDKGDPPIRLAKFADVAR